ncbi:MAG: lipid-A-disaccharide synthase [Pseudomonadota bacterium]
MAERKPRIGIVAGEASGDMLGSLLIQALRQYLPGAEFIGIGGPKMQALGMRTLFPMEKLAVRGYVEVLRHYREIVGIRNKLRSYFLAERPDVFVGVDAPDFNLDLECALKAGGIPTVHYVCPSIWAWRGERIHKIRRAVAEVLALFPFEAPLLERAGIGAHYVGHPLADMLPEKADRAAAREQLRLPANIPVIALLPGSRQSEVRQMTDLFIRTAMLMAEKLPDAQFLVPLISRETRNLFEAAIYRNHAFELPLTVLFGHAHDAMAAADIVLVASGTATLEAALLKRPMVITYKMPKLSWAIMRRKKYLPYVGLPNILAGEFVVPEILQDDATPENLAQALLNLLHDEVVKRRLEQRFLSLHLELRQNAGERAAQALLPYLREAT